IWAFGTKSNVQSAFDVASTDISSFNLPSDWRDGGRLHLKRFLEDGLAQALTRDLALMTRRRGSQTWVVSDHSDTDFGSLEHFYTGTGKTTGLVPGVSVPPSEKGEGVPKVHYAEGAEINLSFADDRLWGLITPDVWITPMFARRYAENFLKNRKRDRYNKKHDELVSAWMSVFTDGAKPAELIQVSAFGDGTDCGDASFSFVNRTGYSWRALA
ncbi:MAG: SIR2 family protein, partial [Pseudomonadota bacterium]